MSTSMIFDIRPYRGAGPIEFGMTRADVRKRLGAYQSFSKSPDASMPTDAFDGVGAHVYYNGLGRCEAIELFEPARVVLDGRPLLGQEFRQLKDLVLASDPALMVDGVGFISTAFGWGVTADGWEEEPLAQVEGVIVFERGYYERQ